MDDLLNKDFFNEMSKVLVEKYVQETEASFQRTFSDRDKKITLITELCQKDVLDIPTQGLVCGWMNEDVDFLSNLLNRGALTPDLPVREVEFSVSGCCHAISAFYLVSNYGTVNQRKLYTGFASRTWRHSWLVDEVAGEILEPTPHDHSSYFGYHVSEPSFFIADQIAVLEQLRDEYVLGAIEIEMFNAGCKQKGYPFAL